MQESSVETLAHWTGSYRQINWRSDFSMTRLLPMRLCAILCLHVCVACVISAEKVRDIHPTGYVTDLARVVKPETTANLEALCTELEEKTGAQMAIVTVHSLEGESVEQFANDLFKQLGVGSKKDSRGVLLLVASDEHKYWTEVGYGLEPVINDARAGDAGRLMVPFLKQGDYSDAIRTAAWQLAKYIADDRGATLSAQPRSRTPQQKEGSGIPLTTWLIIAALVFFVLVRAIGSMSGGGRRGGGSGGSGLLWFLLGMLSNGSAGRSGGGGFGGGGFGGGGGGFGGFGGGSSGGGGAGGSW
jgi:uncharacterized protein